MNTKINPNIDAAYEPIVFPQQQQQIKYKREKKLLFVSSIHRDIEYYSNPGDFKIKFDTYRDVTNVKLIDGIIPNMDGVVDDGIVMLYIPELNYMKTSNGNTIFDSMVLKSHPSSNFLKLDIPVIKSFELPQVKSKLDSLSITFMHPDERTVDFGTGTNSKNQTYLTFEITSYVPSY